MSNPSTFHCPHCKQEIELTQALKHEISAQSQAEAQEALRIALAEQATKFAQLEKKKLQELESENKQKMAQLESSAKSKFEYELKLAIQEKEALQLETRKRQEELLQFARKQRQLEQQMQDKELELEKKLLTERQILQKNAIAQIEDQMRLKLAEKDKQIADAKRANEEMTRKLAQGSQQTQGEVLELEIEQMLKQLFPQDTIREVPKGIRGADVIQVVRNEKGLEVGSILWESKNTKVYQPAWLAKLRSDQRTVKAEIAVLVSVVLPPEIKHFAYKDGIMLCQHNLISAVAEITRRQLIAISKIRTSEINKSEKSAVVYQYLSGSEFRQRMEAISENYLAMKVDIEKEKRFYDLKWARQEKYLRQLQIHTHGMYGDLQAIMGRELPELESELLLSEESAGD